MWRSLLLLGRAYPLSELSWRLCVFSWYSSYVRRWWDGFQYSSTCCQACVGACSHVLPCQELKVVTFCGPGPTSLSRCWEPPDMAVGGVGVPLARLRGGGWFIVGWQEMKSCQSTLIMMRQRSGSFLGLILFLGRWLLPFSQEWWGCIRYGVRGVVCHWSEPLMSKFYGS
jgi:hypothetical protein